MTGIIDTHCHLFFDNLFSDIDAVIERAIAQGVEAFVVPGIDVETSKLAIQLAETYPMVYAAIGIHPNSDIEPTDRVFTQIQQLLPHPKVVAIGEIGLDYYRNKFNSDKQKILLKHQLDIATEYQLPIILHNRNAMDDLFECVQQWQNRISPSQNRKPKGVFHAFSEDLNWAKQVIQMGFFIGVGGVITYPKAHLLRDVVQSIPIDYLLLETDAPFLPPQPFRGKSNEPAYLPIIVNELSTELNIGKDVLIKTTHRNSKILFGLN